MSAPFIAEIRIFAGNFAPRGWSFCSGQLLPISQNTALFSLIGSTYGGDGKTTMGLPNLQGRAPMHPGRGPGLSDRVLGEQSGSETVTLTASTMASHNHVARGSTDPGGANTASGNVVAKGSGRGVAFYGPAANLQAMNPSSLGQTGGNQSHNNMQPYLVLNFIIALAGIFPTRS